MTYIKGLLSLVTHARAFALKFENIGQTFSNLTCEIQNGVDKWRWPWRSNEKSGGKKLFKSVSEKKREWERSRKRIFLENNINETPSGL